MESRLVTIYWTAGVGRGWERARVQRTIVSTFTDAEAEAMVVDSFNRLSISTDRLDMVTVELWRDTLKRENAS